MKYSFQIKQNCRSLISLQQEFRESENLRVEFTQTLKFREVFPSEYLSKITLSLLLISEVDTL
jgi:hypothetical protein